MDRRFHSNPRYRTCRGHLNLGKPGTDFRTDCCCDNPVSSVRKASRVGSDFYRLTLMQQSPRVRPNCFLAILWLNLLLCAPSYAQTQIAVLDFELKDLTLDPNTSQEIERTASIKAMLDNILENRGNYSTIAIEKSSHRKADVATGYLFDHFDAAAELGRKYGADYILVGRVHKASFLFVYLMVRMVDTRTEQLVGNYICEVKGPQKQLTVKGIECLVEKIHRTLHPS